MMKETTSSESQLTPRDSTLKDISLVCGDCGESFIFKPGEQIFYHDKGFPNPKRCQVCREWRRSTLPNGGVRLGANGEVA